MSEDCRRNVSNYETALKTQYEGAQWCRALAATTVVLIVAGQRSKGAKGIGETRAGRSSQLSR
jgi:hypothetical protein